MSTPTTSSQMKNKIDQDITSNQGVKKSINPTLLGTLLKIVVDWVEVRIGAVNTSISNLSNSISNTINTLTGRVTALEEAELPVSADEGNTLEAREDGLYVPTPEGGGTSTVSYLKDETITEAQVGRLAMMKEYRASFTIVGYGLLVSALIDIEVGDTISDGEGNVGEVIFIGYDEVEENWSLGYKVVTGSFADSETLTNGTGGSATVITQFPSFGETVVNAILQEFGNSETNFINATNLIEEEGVVRFDIVSEGGDSNTINFVLFFDEEDFVGGAVIENITEKQELATLGQTSPAIPPTLLQAEISVQGLVGEDEPTMKIVRITFNGDNIQDGQSITLAGDDADNNNFGAVLTFANSPTADQVQIGATLSDTLDNLETFLGSHALGDYFGVADRNATTSFDFYLYEGFQDETAIQDGLGFAAFRIDGSLSGDIGDSGGGGLATYTTVQGLTNNLLVEKIAVNGSSGMIDYLVNYNSLMENEQVLFLTFNNIYKNSGVKSVGAMGLQWFTTDEELEDAVQWALLNDMNFTDKFTLLGTTVDSGVVTATIQAIDPQYNGNTTFSFTPREENNIEEEVTATITVTSLTGCPPIVKDIVLGRIAGIDGENVLIDNSPILELEMATDEEFEEVNTVERANMHTIVPPKRLYAWNDGKVVSYSAYIQKYPFLIGGGDGNDWKQLSVGAVFLPMHSASGGEKVKAIRHNASIIPIRELIQ